MQFKVHLCCSIPKICKLTLIPNQLLHNMEIRRRVTHSVGKSPDWKQGCPLQLTINETLIEPFALKGTAFSVCVRTNFVFQRWNKRRKRRAPRTRNSLAQHAAAGGVLGKVGNETESRRCLCHSSIRNETVRSVAPDERDNQPRGGEMVLGGGVSPRSSGKRNEPQSGDTSYDTDTVGTAPVLTQTLQA
jgi:hypothetical protein